VIKVGSDDEVTKLLDYLYYFHNLVMHYAQGLTTREVRKTAMITKGYSDRWTRAEETKYLQPTAACAQRHYDFLNYSRDGYLFGTIKLPLLALPAARSARLNNGSIVLARIESQFTHSRGTRGQGDWKI